MAIDPSISLGVRVAQPDIQIQSPIQQAAQLMSLRDMMARQQMMPIQLQEAQLGLEQAQRAQRDDQILRQSYADAGGDLDKTQTLLMQRGGSPASLFKIRQAQLEMR